MAKYKAKVANITGMNPTQIENALANALSNGWEIIQFVPVGSNMFAVLQKQISA